MGKLISTPVGDLAVWHTVPALGPGVAENVVGLIKDYANRAGLKEIPPINLLRPGWDAPWEELARVEKCTGSSGPSNAELAEGGIYYTCLSIELPSGQPYPLDPEPRTVEGVIAHEICHLRWPRLPHVTPEFTARVLALLRGATFPTKGGWRQKTKSTMQETRREATVWYRSTFGFGEGES